ncbi:MAG: MFS transporter [Cyanobacteria bacterium J06638_20]
MLRESEPDFPTDELVGEASESMLTVDASSSIANADAEVTGFWPVLKNRNFLVLWSGQVFSQLADKIYLVLMIAIIGSQFDAPEQSISGWVSAVMVAFTIPAVLFGSLAGVYVDRTRKQGVLVLTNVLRGGLVLALPLALWLSQSWGTVFHVPVGFALLLAITFAVSTLTQFFAPAEQAIIPLMMETKYLLSANSLYTTTMMASVILGFALGEPLLAIADSLLKSIDGGQGWGKSILVGSGYLVAGLLLLLVRVREDRDPDHESPHPWEDIKDGLRYLRDQPPVRNAIVQLVVLFSVFAALAVLAVRLAEVIPALKSEQFGFLLAAGGVGMAIGAALIGQFGTQIKRSYLTLLGSLGMAGVLVAMSFVTRQLWPTLGLIALMGVFAAAVGIPMQTTIQEKTPAAMRGKVFGLQNNLVNIALSLPLALASLAEGFLGLPLVFMGLGAIVATGGLLTWYSAGTGNDGAEIASFPQD